MIGDRYRVKHNCSNGRFQLRQNEILIEHGAYNFETEEYGDGGEHNDLLNDKNEFVCEVGSKFTSDNLELIMD